MKISKAIVCWVLLIFLATTFSLAQSSGSSALEKQKSCRDFVQAFYDWYVPKALKDSDVPASDLALKYKGALFSPELLRALRDDSQAQGNAKGEIVGLDFDPFLNSQDPSQHYTLGNVTSKDGRCSVELYSVSSGKKSEKAVVVPELVLKDGHWMFINFHYGKSKHSEDENLVNTLKSLRVDRLKYSK